jgi:hypothetical protein
MGCHLQHHKNRQRRYAARRRFLMRRRQFLQTAGVFLGSVFWTMQPFSAALGGPSMRYDTWKTVCVGNYLVDVPEHVPLTYLAYFGFGLSPTPELKRTPGSPADAQKMAEEKARELKATPHDTEGSLYIRSIPLPNGGVLVQGWGFKFSVDSSKAFLYLPVSTRGKSFIYTYTKTIFMRREQKQLQDFMAFASSFRPLPEGLIPKEPGLCLEDVMLVNLPDAVVDRCAVRLDDPHAKGLVLSFVVRTVQTDFPWLTKEPGWAEEECALLEGSEKCDQLRFGKHPVGPIQGEEICIAGKTYDGKRRTYRFEWENPGVPNSRTAPLLTASLLYGGAPIEHPGAPAPFASDTDALATWDRFVNSIRIRPVA